MAISGSDGAGTIWRVGPLSFDEGRYQIRRDGKPIVLQRHVAELLFFLIHSDGRLVTAADLRRGPWKGTSVSEAALRRALMLARNAVAGPDVPADLITTVRGKGIRFTGQVVRACASDHPVRSSVEPAESDASRDPQQTSGMVGREAELGTFRAHWERARSGPGGVLWVLGPVGIGKTRLLEHFAGLAQRDGADVFWGRAWEAEGAPPFTLWSDVVRPLVAAGHDRRRSSDLQKASSDVRSLLPELRSRRRVRGEAREVHVLGDRFRVFSSLARLLEHAVSSGPKLVLLEDLHFADEASISMLRFLRGSIPKGLLVVVSCRTGAFVREPGNDVPAVRDDPLEWNVPRDERIDLGGLSLTELPALVRTLSSRGLSTVALAALHEATAGHPLLIETLAHAGLLASFEEEAGPHLPPLPVPLRIARVVQAEMSTFPAETLQMLASAAVIGREFTLALLGVISGVSAEEVLQRLEPARRIGLIEELREAPGHLRFRHALLRELVYQDLAPAARRERHRTLADHLESSSGNDETVMSQLAHHAAAAVPVGDLGRAVRVTLRAAQQAEDVFAYELSASHYRRALRLLESSPRRDADEQRTVLLGLAKADALAGHHDRALDSLEEALKIARLARDQDGFAEGVLACFDLAREAAILRPAFHARVHEALAERQQDDWRRARLLAVSAIIGHFYTRHRERLQQVDEAVAMARRLGDTETLRAVLRFSHFAILHPGRVRENLARASEITASSRERRCRVGELEGLFWEAQHGLDLGDAELFSRAQQRHATLAEYVRQPIHLWYAGLLRVTRNFQDGRLDRAESALRKLLSRALPMLGNTVAESTTAGHLMTIAWHLEPGPGRRAMLEEVRSLAGRVLEVVPVFTPWRLVVDVLERELGDAHGAPWPESKFHQWLEGLPDDAHLLLCLVMLVHVAVTSPVTARGVFIAVQRRLEPFADLHASVSTLDWGPVAFHLALLDQALQELQRAKARLLEALERSERARSLPWQRQARRALARLSEQQQARVGGLRSV